MKKFALYIRCSTVHNIGGLESQKDALTRYVESKGTRPNDYVVYEDKAISGARESRPALNILMEDCRNGKIEAVLVVSFSRFARSTQHLLSALNEFNRLGIHFISLSENIDTSTSIGRMVFTMVASIAEFERSLIQERVRRGLQTARNKGKTLGRPKKRNGALIRELLNKKLTYDQISELTGVSHWCIAQESKFLKNLERLVS